jgi:hypothetical protein
MTEGAKTNEDQVSGRRAMAITTSLRWVFPASRARHLQGPGDKYCTPAQQGNPHPALRRVYTDQRAIRRVKSKPYKIEPRAERSKSSMRWGPLA